MARLMTREAAAARASARAHEMAHPQPVQRVGGDHAGGEDEAQQRGEEPAREVGAGDGEEHRLADSVSKEIANAAPTAAMSTGCSARVRRSKRRLRTPAARTTSPRGVRSDGGEVRDAQQREERDRDPGARRSRATRGARHSVATVATTTATSVTTTPWPAEKSSPDQRERRGWRSALKRVSPSMAARWSGSSPCLRPEQEDDGDEREPVGGKGFHLFGEEELVPEAFPLLRLRSSTVSGSIITNGKLLSSLFTGARGHAAHRFEELLSFRREHEVDEEQRRVRDAARAARRRCPAGARPPAAPARSRSARPCA